MNYIIKRLMAEYNRSFNSLVYVNIYNTWFPNDVTYQHYTLGTTSVTPKETFIYK